MREFVVHFHGPDNTAYSEGLWKVNVRLPKDYPIKSPSIGFVNRIYHPNVDEMSGSVCLDVINQTWTPMFDLVNVFDIFMPQLLTYPNPLSPLNGEAANMLTQDQERYERFVKQHVLIHARKPEAPKPEKESSTTIIESVAASPIPTSLAFSADSAVTSLASEYSIVSASSLGSSGSGLAVPTHLAAIMEESPVAHMEIDGEKDDGLDGGCVVSGNDGESTDGGESESEHDDAFWDCISDVSEMSIDEDW